jgi:NAD(P)-dependent dehydrogenase (short-subunit alcohol dehydrogenase family)
MTRPLQLTGAAVVLTGAGSGIGRASAVAVARRGARVVVSDVDHDRARAVAEEITAAGGEALALRVDVTREADLAALRDACLERFGRVDVVMNNVGVLALGAPESLPDEAWRRVLDLNLMSIARSNRVFLPLLLDQCSGHVVNTASASGLLAYGFDRLPYVASKHAVVGLSEALALYLGPHGVGVTCVCPSGVITNIMEQITVYGRAAASPRAPDHPLVSAETVGELVAARPEACRRYRPTTPTSTRPGHTAIVTRRPHLTARRAAGPWDRATEAHHGAGRGRAWPGGVRPPPRSSSTSTSAWFGTGSRSRSSTGALPTCPSWRRCGLGRAAVAKSARSAPTRAQ